MRAGTYGLVESVAENLDWVEDIFASHVARPFVIAATASSSSNDAWVQAKTNAPIFDNPYTADLRQPDVLAQVDSSASYDTDVPLELSLNTA